MANDTTIESNNDINIFSKFDKIKKEIGTKNRALRLYLDYTKTFSIKERKVIDAFRLVYEEEKKDITVLETMSDYDKNVIVKYINWSDSLPNCFLTYWWYLLKQVGKHPCSCEPEPEDNNKEYIKSKDFDIDRYIQKRWSDQKDYFDRKASKAQKEYRRINRWLIILGAASSLIISLHFNGILNFLPTQEETQQQELFDNYTMCYNQLEIMRPYLEKEALAFDSLPIPFFIKGMEENVISTLYQRSYEMLKNQIQKDITNYKKLPILKEKQEQKSLNNNYEKCYNLLQEKRTSLSNDEIAILDALPDLSQDTSKQIDLVNHYQKCYEILQKNIEQDSINFTQLCAPKNISNIGKGWMVIQDLDIEKGLCAIFSFVIVILTGFNRLMKHYEEWHRNRENCEKLNRELFNFHFNVGVYKIEEEDSNVIKQKKESKFVERVETIINDYIRDMLSEKDKITPQQIKEIIDEYKKTGQEQGNPDKTDGKA